MKKMQMACGTVTGRSHLRPLGWRNNQDSVSTLDLIESDGIAVAVVADGCSSGYVPGTTSHNEVGAQIAAKIVACKILKYVPLYLKVVKGGADPLVFPYMEDVRQDLLAHLRTLAQAMDQSLARVVSDNFLFTLIGFLVTPHGSFVFSIGDGVYFVNGEMARIGPFERNEPPYVGYGLLRDGQHPAKPEDYKFKINRAILTSDLESILVGSDGFVEFIDAAAKPLPGKKPGDLVGPASQFWEDDACFANPDTIRRRLALANNSYTAADWKGEKFIKEHGLLDDDTTIAVVRRREAPTKGTQ